jgi:hypothetical protein
VFFLSFVFLLKVSEVLLGIQLRDANRLAHTSAILFYSFLQVAFNPIDRTLYVLSEESKKVLQTTLTGELIGDSLDVSIANQPEGIHFVPSTGEMWISSEPNQLLQFSATGSRNTDSASPSIFAPSSFLLLLLGLML